MRLFKTILFFLSTVVLFAVASVVFEYYQEPPQKILGFYTATIDGDTLIIGENKIRIEGIDAPEKAQICASLKGIEPCGEQAWKELVRLVHDNALICSVSGKDRYNRILARCTREDDTDIGAEMVRNGYAFAYGAYENEEKEAKAAKRGLWNMEFEKPQDWRKRKAETYYGRAFARPHTPLYMEHIISVIDRLIVDKFIKRKRQVF